MPKLKTDYDLLVITGPTASGKTSLAVAVADAAGGEIISADSRQVYRGMNLGTGKDYEDYKINGRIIPFHLIDIVDPGYKYNVFEYQHDFIRVYNDLKSRKVLPVVCGGSGMYVDSIVKGYRMYEVPPDKELRTMLEKKSMEELTEILRTYRKLHNVTDTDSRKRVIRAIEIEQYNRSAGKKQADFPEIRSLITGVSIDRETRRKRISERLKQRLENGMIEEVKRLLDEGMSHESLIYYGLEYKFITLYLAGKMTYDEMVESLEIAIHQFAKRQMTWFRGMERKGTRIHWIDGGLAMKEKVKQVIGLLKV